MKHPSPAPAPPPAAAPLSCFAVTAPGLEPITATELRALGAAPRVETGGVAWEGDLASVYRANLWLRTASRVIVRAAAFRVRAFYELERHAKRIAWASWLAPGGAVRFRVTAKKSKLYHTEAVAERLAAAVARALPGVRLVGEGGGGEEDDGEDGSGDAPAQLVVVRLAHDQLTLSVDSSGALLHRRGYRQALAKAPLRETLAAALLLGSGWDGGAPLVDPMCGSGTIVIEGALLARRIAPGLHRRFAFMEWPGFDAERWARLLDAARERTLAASPVVIQGSDRDAGAVAAARANAERAGVGADIALAVRPLSAIEPPPGPGWVATNPPYGVRVGEGDRVRDLYAQLGHVLRSRCGGWTVAMLSPGPRLDGQLRLRLAERLRTRNGGIPVRLVTGVVGERAGSVRGAVG